MGKPDEWRAIGLLLALEGQNFRELTFHALRQKEGGTGVNTDPTATVSTMHLQEPGALGAFARGVAENLAF